MSAVAGRPGWGRLCLGLAVVATGLAVVAMGWRVLAVWPLDVHLRDDAYYYFLWAQSLAAGAGPCVTEGVPTSGVHVFWGLLLAAFAWLGALPTTSVVVGLMLHVATAGVVWRAAGGARCVGLAVAGLYLGSHYLTFEAMNGQETALGALMLAVLCTLRNPGPVWFTLVATLTIAARSDLVFFVAVAALCGEGPRLGRFLGVVVAVLLYAGWNYLLAGEWLQDSAFPIPWLMAEEFAHTGPERWARAEPHLRTLGQLVPFRQASTAFALAWVGMAIVDLRERRLRYPLMFGAGVVLFAFHALYREYPRDYYFAPLGVLGALALVDLCRAHPRLGLGLAILGLAWNGWHLLDAPPHRGWQREMTLAGRHVDAFVPNRAAVGAFNSGIVGWTRGAGVVNLDGVVNRPAFEALRRHELGGFLARNQIAYLLDNPVQFANSGIHSNGRHFGEGFSASLDLEEVARFVWPGDPGAPHRRAGTEWIGLYRFRSMGPEPKRIPELCDLGPRGASARVLAWPARRGQRMWCAEAGAVPAEGAVPVLIADADVVYVLSVPMRRADGLAVFVDTRDAPILTIAGGR